MTVYQIRYLGKKLINISLLYSYDFQVHQMGKILAINIFIDKRQLNWNKQHDFVDIKMKLFGSNGNTE